MGGGNSGSDETVGKLRDAIKGAKRTLSGNDRGTGRFAGKVGGAPRAVSGNSGSGRVLNKVIRAL